LFLPCSRPKQRSGHSDRLGRSGIQAHDATVGFTGQTVFRNRAGIENGA
jgi:hypothetical protein